MLRGEVCDERRLDGTGIACRGSRLVSTVEICEGGIVGLNAFLDTDRLFPLFGLPSHLER